MPSQCATTVLPDDDDGGPFTAAHLGDLTSVIPPDMVDQVLRDTHRTQRRIRALPARAVVYLLLAAALFADMGYEQVWERLTAGTRAHRVPSSSALTQARRRVGVAPLRALFGLLAGAGAGAPVARVGRLRDRRHHPGRSRQ